jgi:hypothetical protein
MGIPKEAAMPVLMMMDLPVRRGDLEAVSEDMGVHENPPDGLILHVMTETTNGVHVTDVWESQAAFEAFRDAKLMPSMQKVLTERGVPMDGAPPEPSFDEAFDLVRGVGTRV